MTRKFSPLLVHLSASKEWRLRNMEKEEAAWLVVAVDEHGAMLSWFFRLGDTGPAQGYVQRPLERVTDAALSEAMNRCLAYWKRRCRSQVVPRCLITSYYTSSSHTCMQAAAIAWPEVRCTLFERMYQDCLNQTTDWMFVYVERYLAWTGNESHMRPYCVVCAERIAVSSNRPYSLRGCSNCLTCANCMTRCARCGHLRLCLCRHPNDVRQDCLPCASDLMHR